MKRALLLLLAVALAAPGALAQDHDHHEGEEDEAHETPAGSDPWGGLDTGEFPARLERLTFHKGDVFTFEVDTRGTLEQKSYTVLDVSTMEVEGEPREVIHYGWDRIDTTRGLRDTYVEYRDAATFDLIRIEKSGSSSTADGEVSRSTVTTWSPPFREAAFPLEVGRVWNNRAIVTEDNSVTYPQTGKITPETSQSIVASSAAVTKVVNVTVAGRNVSTFQVLMRDDTGSNRTDRYNWHPALPVPVRIVRFQPHADGNVTVLQTYKLVDWVMGTLPEFEAAAPASARVNEPVVLGALGTDPAHRILAFAWSFGDPSDGANNSYSARLRGDEDLRPGEVIPSVTHAWKRPGTYTARLVVAVSGDLYLNRTVTVTVMNDPPVARVADFGDAALGEPFTLDATASTDAEGPVVDFQWEFEDGVTLSGPIVTREFTLARTRGTLTVTDGLGATDTLDFLVDAKPGGSAPGTPRDTVGPSLALNLTRAVGAPTLSVKVTATDGDGVAYVRLRVNGDIVGTSRDATAYFTVATSALKVGDNRVMAEAWDSRGLNSTRTEIHRYDPVAEAPKPPSWNDIAKQGEPPTVPTAPAKTESAPAAPAKGLFSPGPGAIVMLVGLGLLALVFGRRR